jgi:Ca2+-binding RTX toxin-like protein
MVGTLRSAVVLGCVVLATGSAAGSPAMAQTATCTYDPDSHSVSALFQWGLAVVDGRIGTLALPRGRFEPCGDATVFNTDTVYVSENPALTLQLRGSFAPGLTPEDDGLSEIEIHVQPASGQTHMLVYGSSGADVFVLGTNGLDVNGDGDVDVLVEARRVILKLQDGGDAFSARRAGSVGLPFEQSVVIYGASGRDEILLGRAWGHVYGGSGQDLVAGGKQARRKHFLEGGAGGDVIRAGPGKDYLSGQGGHDRLFGGPGIDRCTDRAVGDVLRSCEKQ